MRTTLSFCASGLVGSLAAAVAAADVAPAYTATLITSRAARDFWTIADNGFAVGSGSVEVNGTQRTVPGFWTPGAGFQPVFPDDPTFGSLVDVTRRRDSVGNRGDDWFVRLQDGQFAPLNPLDPGDDGLRIDAFNNRTVAIGNSSNFDDADRLTVWQRQGFDTWTPREVPNAPQTRFVRATDLSNGFDAVGTYSDAGEPNRAFLLEDLLSSSPRLIDLGTLGGGDAQANAINERGQIVGTSSNATGAQRAFVWTTADGMTQLGDLGISSSFAAAYALNDNGIIVGQYGPRATIWDADGSAFDLNDLLATPIQGSLVQAEAINDEGLIIARTRGGQGVYLLTPIPAPGTLALLGLAPLMVRRRR